MGYRVVPATEVFVDRRIVVGPGVASGSGSDRW